MAPNKGNGNQGIEELKHKYAPKPKPEKTKPVDGRRRCKADPKALAADCGREHDFGGHDEGRV